MCDPISATVGLLAGSMAMSSMNKQPEIPAPPTVEKPPQQQQEKAPTHSAAMTKNREAATGFGSTFLTGPMGLAPGATSLGSNTLLGM